jgi:hypothetical protein
MAPTNGRENTAHLYQSLKDRRVDCFLSMNGVMQLDNRRRFLEDCSSHLNDSRLLAIGNAYVAAMRGWIVRIVAIKSKRFDMRTAWMRRPGVPYHCKASCAIWIRWAFACKKCNMSPRVCSTVCCYHWPCSTIPANFSISVNRTRTALTEAAANTHRRNAMRG